MLRTEESNAIKKKCPHQRTRIVANADRCARGRIDHEVCTSCGEVVDWDIVR